MPHNVSGHYVSVGVGDPRIVRVDVDVLSDVAVKLPDEIFIELDIACVGLG